MRPPSGAYGSVAAGAPTVVTVEPSRSPATLRSNPVRLVIDACTIALASSPPSGPVIASRNGTSPPSVVWAGCSSSVTRAAVAGASAACAGVGAAARATIAATTTATAIRLTGTGP